MQARKLLWTVAEKLMNRRDRVPSLLHQTQPLYQLLPLALAKPVPALTLGSELADRIGRTARFGGIRPGRPPT